MDFTPVLDYIQDLNPNTLLGIAALSGVFYVLSGIIKSTFGMVSGGIKKLSFYNMEVFYANSDYNLFTKWNR